MIEELLKAFALRVYQLGGDTSNLVFDLMIDRRHIRYVKIFGTRLTVDNIEPLALFALSLPVKYRKDAIYPQSTIGRHSSSGVGSASNASVKP